MAALRLLRPLRAASLAALATLAALFLGAAPLAAQATAEFGRHMDDGFAARRRGDMEGAIRSFRLAIAADTGSARARFELGYAYLQAARRGEAARAFEEGVVRDPAYVDAHRQLGYLYSATGRLGEAALAFETARTLGVVDARDRLELGLVEVRRGDRAAAERALGEAAAAADTVIAAAARRALASLRGEAPPAAATSAPVARGWSLATRPRFADLYAAPLYQTRYANVVAQLVARAGVVLEDRTRLSPYVSLRVSRDTRSRGGPQPVVFSDNVVIPAAGVRFQPLRGAGLPGLYVYGEAGAAIPLVDVGPTSRVRDDVRAGGFLIQQWRGSAGGRALTSDLYADASWYSRFDRDAIMFAQLRESVAIVGNGVGKGVEAFGRLWTVVDSRRVYYNNAVEVGPGLALYPLASRRAFVFLEALAGRYLIDPGPGVARTYHDARVTVILSAYRWSEPGRR